jgi:hypothetical protein
MELENYVGELRGGGQVHAAALESPPAAAASLE